jgi:uncharacterized membrane protein
MSETRTFRERLKGILEIGIEHSYKHSEDLRKLGLEARIEADEALAEGLLEAAEMSQALASKLKELLERIG